MAQRIKLREFTVKLAPRHYDEKTVTHTFDFGTLNEDYYITNMKIGFENNINNPVKVTELEVVVAGFWIFKVKNPTDVSNLEFSVEKNKTTSFIVKTDKPTLVTFTTSAIC